MKLGERQSALGRNSLERSEVPFNDDDGRLSVLHSIQCHRCSDTVSGNGTFLDREKIESSGTPRIRRCVMDGGLPVGDFSDRRCQFTLWTTLVFALYDIIPFLSNCRGSSLTIVKSRKGAVRDESID